MQRTAFRGFSGVAGAVSRSCSSSDASLSEELDENSHFTQAHMGRQNAGKLLHARNAEAGKVQRGRGNGRRQQRQQNLPQRFSLEGYSMAAPAPHVALSSLSYSGAAHEDLRLTHSDLTTLSLGLRASML